MSHGCICLFLFIGFSLFLKISYYSVFLWPPPSPHHLKLDVAAPRYGLLSSTNRFWKKLTGRRHSSWEKGNNIFPFLSVCLYFFFPFWLMQAYFIYFNNCRSWEKVIFFTFKGYLISFLLYILWHYVFVIFFLDIQCHISIFCFYLHL